MTRARFSLNQTLTNLLIVLIVLIVVFVTIQFFIYRLTFDRMVNETSKEVVARMDNAISLSLSILDARFTRIEPALRDRHLRARSIITSTGHTIGSVNLDLVRQIIADGVTTDYDLTVIDEHGVVINSTDRHLFGSVFTTDEYTPAYMGDLPPHGQPRIISPMLDFDDGELLAVASSRIIDTPYTLVTTFILKDASGVFREIWSENDGASGLITNVSVLARTPGTDWKPLLSAGSATFDEDDAALAERSLTEGLIDDTAAHGKDHRSHVFFVPATASLPAFAGGNARLAYKLSLDLDSHHDGLARLSTVSGAVSLMLMAVVGGIMVWVRIRVLNPFHDVITDITASRPVTDPAILVRGDELTLLAESFNRHITTYYEGVVEQAPVGIAIFDADTLTHASGNSRFFDLIGAAPAEVPPLETILASAGDVKDTLGAVVSAGAEAEFDITASDRHDTRRTLRALVYPVEWAGRTMVSVSLMDISDRVEFARANALQASMLEQVDSAVTATDIDFRIIFWNAAAERLFGYTAEQVMGRTMAEVVVPADKAGESARNRSRLAAEGRMATQMTLLRANGSTFEADVTISRITGIDEETIGFVGVTKDITESLEHQREIAESEQRFRTLSRQFAALLDAIPDAIVLISATYDILWANRSAMAMYGADADRLTGEHCYQLIRGEHDVCPDCPAHICLSHGGLTSHTRFMPDGRRIEVTLYPIPTEGEINQFIHVGRDITERLRIETEATRTRHLSLLGQLSAGIAHEINNPNNFITLNASMLKDIWQDAKRYLTAAAEDEGGSISLGGLPFPESDKDIAKLISSIEDGAGRIKTIVADLKKYATQDRVKHLERVRMNDVVRAAAGILKNRIKTARCTFDVVYADELPPVMGNTGRLEQVIMNIIMNALEALPGPGGRITVATALRNRGQTVCIDVIDTGVGMDEATIERIFEPFFSTKFKSGGTGLGMSITYSIIKEHGGDITVKSKPGKGTTMTICLPTG